MTDPDPDPDPDPESEPEFVSVCVFIGASVKIIVDIVSNTLTCAWSRRQREIRWAVVARRSLVPAKEMRPLSTPRRRESNEMLSLVDMPVFCNVAWV